MKTYKTKTSNPDPEYVTEKDGQRVRVWSADGKLDYVIDDDVRAWLWNKLTVSARSGLEFVHKKYLSTMIARGDLVRDERDIATVRVTEQAVARYGLPALDTIKAPKNVVERASVLSVVPVMTESDKIAAAKRALEAARADAEALRKGIETASPVEGIAVRLWVDDAKIGCGERSFLVREIGPKAVKLFYPGLLADVEVDRLTFDRFAKPYAIKAAKVLSRIEETAAVFDRNDVEYSPKAVKAVQAMVMAA